jgi:CHAD domain-containing protein
MTALLKTASKQWDVLRHAWNDVLRDANEDSVHELRVASRRILSCLSLVDSILLANHRSKARRKIKRLMKKLGPLRDVQVQTSISKSWPRTKAPLGFQEYLKRRIVTKSKAVQSYLTDKRKRAIRGSLKDAELDARRSLQDLSPALVRSRLSSALESQRDEFHAAKRAAKSQDRRRFTAFASPPNASVILWRRWIRTSQKILMRKCARCGAIKKTSAGRGISPS